MGIPSRCRLASAPVAGGCASQPAMQRHIAVVALVVVVATTVTFAAPAKTEVVHELDADAASERGTFELGMAKSSSPAPGKAPAAAKEAATPAKKAGGAPASYKAAQAHIQNLVDNTDIGKLVTRSKRALAKRVLERQAKVAPKDPNPEPLSDREKKEQKAAAEKKLKRDKLLEKKQVAAMKKAVVNAKDAKAKSTINKHITEVHGQKAVAKAEEKRVAANSKARNSVNDARHDAQEAQKALDHIKDRMDKVVHSGNAKALHALQVQKKAAQAKVKAANRAVVDATRASEDTKTAGANSLVDAKVASNVANEKAADTAKMAQDKVESTVKRAASKATASANKVAADQKAKAKVEQKPAAKPKENWQRHAEHVFANAKETVSSKKGPGKGRSQERSEKADLVIQKAHVMIEKIKKLNEMAKDRTAAPVKAGQTSAAVANADAEKLAMEAEREAKVASDAAEKVGVLEAKAVVDKGAATALAAAKAAEQKALESANAALAKAKAAAENGGTAGKKVAAKADAKAKQTKLKAEADKAKAEADKAKVAAPGDQKKVAAATKKAEKAKAAAKTAMVKADAKQALPKADAAADKAKQDQAAAHVLAKGVNAIPGVSSIHSQSVKEIVKARFAEQIANGDKKVPTKKKAPPAAKKKAPPAKGSSTAGKKEAPPAAKKPTKKP